VETKPAPGDRDAFVAEMKMRHQNLSLNKFSGLFSSPLSSTLTTLFPHHVRIYYAALVILASVFVDMSRHKRPARLEILGRSRTSKR
jgi:hypothetical protein